jgi:hypothetical protein
VVAAHTARSIATDSFERIEDRNNEDMMTESDKVELGAQELRVLARCAAECAEEVLTLATDGHAERALTTHPSESSSKGPDECV